MTVALATLVGSAVTSHAAAPFSATGSMVNAHQRSTVTTLAGGDVLVAGGNGANGLVTGAADRYNPATGTWTATGSMQKPRTYGAAALLGNGKVLVAGGTDSTGNATASAELYDPATGTWSNTGSMNTARTFNTSMTTLPSGLVLFAGGGVSSGSLAYATAELYNPATGTWSYTGSMSVVRQFGAQVLLPSGLVLFAGGNHGSTFPAAAELYNPASGTWTSTGAMVTPRVNESLTVLSSGKVLAAGGQQCCYPTIASAELFDPATGTWTATGAMSTPRVNHTATRLANGTVLITGGEDAGGAFLSSAEIYDPAAGSFSAAGTMTGPRSRAAAALLASGQVLIAGGASAAAASTTLATADLYTSPVPLPTITAVSPATGPLAAGARVTITGTGLAGASAVTFGTNAASGLSCSATSCTVAAPAGTAGAVDIRVTTPGGTSAVTAADHYTYAAPLPTITSMDPNIGAASSPNSIVVFLYGTNLAGTTSITFGAGHPATGVYCDATMCNFTAPVEGGGTVDVRVTTPAGTSAITNADKFTYQSAATLSSITPASGPTAGGTRVTVTGTDLTGARIYFGTKAATNASCTATSCTVTTPVQSAAGTYQVSADNTVGASQNTLNFTATAPPTVTAVSPAKGPSAGGNKVTITGTNLAIVDGVSFGPGRWVQYGSCTATTCTVTVPPGPGGPVDVQVYSAGGTSAVSAADRYTYLLPPPTITGVSPDSGPSAGGNTITVTGTNLSTVTTVRFGPAGPAPAFSCTATACTVTVPPGSGGIGSVDIQVGTPSGASPVGDADLYTFTG